MLVLLGETRPTSIVDCTPDRVSGPGERPTKRHWTSAMLSRPVLGDRSKQLGSSDVKIVRLPYVLRSEAHCRPKREAWCRKIDLRSLTRSPTEPNGHPIPSIHRGNEKGKVDQIFVTKVFTNQIICFVRCMCRRHVGQRLCPFQGSSFPLRIEGRFTPNNQTIEPLLFFATPYRVLRMTIDAIGAPVDLRNAEPDKMSQGRLNC